MFNLHPHYDFARGSLIGNNWGQTLWIPPLLSREERPRLSGGGHQAGGAQAGTRLRPRHEERRVLRRGARPWIAINVAVAAVAHRGWQDQ